MQYTRDLTEVYDVDCKLGEGAFSSVWRCVHRETRAVRAAKNIGTEHMSPRAIAQETAIMKLCSHPHILRCHDEYITAKDVTVVVDLYPGGDLIDGLNAYQKTRRGPIPEAQLAHLARQMSLAIRQVHSMSIVHRDIKAENFLCDNMDICDPQCKLVLADFGIAKHLTKGETLSDEVGTPEYWAPEVYRKKYDFQADVWAVGVTCWVLQTRELPFEGQHNICKPVELGKQPFLMPPHVTTGQARFFKEVLAKDPERRPSAEEVCGHPWFEGPHRTLPPPPVQTIWHSAIQKAAVIFQLVGQLALGLCECVGEVCYEVLSDDAPKKLTSRTVPPGSPSSAASASSCASQ